MGRLQSSAMRCDKQLIEELQDLASQREVLDSDSIVLGQARETLAQIEERIASREKGRHLLRPATLENDERLLRPATGKHVPEDQMLRAADKTA